MIQPVINPRFDGLDLARALAIAGMALVHFGPTAAPGATGALYALANGRAAVLFMVVAGIGVALLARSRAPTAHHLAGILVWRAVLLIPLGLVLQTLVSGQYVILQTYGVLFLLAPLLVRIPERVLAGVISAGTLVGTTAFLGGRIHAPALFDRSPTDLGTGLGEILLGLAVTGPYPLMVWLAPFALGLWLGRRELARAETQQWLVLAGGAAALGAAGVAAGVQALLAVAAAPEVTAIATDPLAGVGWAEWFSLGAHSQMPLWLISACGIAVVLVGLAGMAASAWRAHLWPLIALGRTALTFYVGHLLVLATWPEALTAEQPAGGLIFTLIALGAGMLFAVIWLRQRQRGPLETLLRAPQAWPFVPRSP